jgi:hypothetical protein
LTAQLEDLPCKPSQQGYIGGLSHENATRHLMGINPQTKGIQKAHPTPDKVLFAMDFGEKEGGEVQTNATHTDQDS